MGNLPAELVWFCVDTVELAALLCSPEVGSAVVADMSLVDVA